MSAEAPFGAPDVQWEMFYGKIPEGAVTCGISNGHPVYVGRVHIDNELLIGSAYLKKGVCIFYRDGTVSESSDFEVLHVPLGDPLIWKKFDSTVSRGTLLKAGRQKTGDILYVGRIQDGTNTFVGSVDINKKQAYIAINWAGKVFDQFEILIHKHLESLYIGPRYLGIARRM